jgi:beta-lactamase regulating signal transducer with metallopeptidase domain
MSDLHPFLEGVGWTLVHFVWQGFLVALLLAGALALVSRRNAGLRYVLAATALTLMLVLPVVTFLHVIGTTAGPEKPTWAGSIALAASVPSILPGNVRAIGPPGLDLQARVSRVLEPTLGWIVGFWITGVVILSLRLTGCLLYLRRLRSTGLRLVSSRWEEVVLRLKAEIGVRRPVTLVESVVVRVPMVIGSLRPVILVPTAAFSGLAPAHLEAIIAHELAHVRRHDFLVNLIQAVAETVLFYHPALWWVSKQIRIEREHCCDDLGAGACGDSLVYARALAELEGLRCRIPALALGATGGGALLRRIRRLFEASKPDRRPQRWLGGAASIAALSLLLAAGAAALWAGGQRFEPPPEPPEPPQLEQPERPPEPPPPPARVRVAAITPPEPPDPPRLAELAEGDAMSAPFQETDQVATLSEEELAGLERQGLDRSLLEELRTAGDRRLPVSELRSWVGHGLDPELVDQLEALGVKDLTVNEALHLVSYGVDGDYVRSLRQLGYDRLSSTDLVMLGRYGIDGAVIEGFRAAGWSDLPVHELTSLGRYGVDPEFARSLATAGRGDLKPHELTTLKRYGVDGAFIAALAERGYDDLDTDELTTLKRYGVEPSYIERAQRAGYDDLTVDQLVAFRRYGVSEEVLARLEASEGEKPSPDRLVELVRYGLLEQETP